MKFIFRSQQQTLASRKRNLKSPSYVESNDSSPNKLWSGKLKLRDRDDRRKLSSNDSALYTDENSGFDIINQVNHLIEILSNYPTLISVILGFRV